MMIGFPPAPSPRKSAAPVRFGICVNEAIKKQAFQDKMLFDSWAMRLHAIASVGGNGKAEVVEALASYLLRNEEKMKNAPLNNDTINFSVLALTESALRNKDLKEDILKTLEQARLANHLRLHVGMIDEAIAKVRADGHKPSSARWQEAEQAFVENRHGHAFGQGGHAHH